MPKAKAAQRHTTLQEIPIEAVVPNPRNPRGEIHLDDEKFGDLVESIKTHGVKVPCLGRPIAGTDGVDLCYGARRLAASIEAGRKTLPVLVREMDDREFFLTMAVENMDRDDLTAVQHGAAVALVLEQFTADGVTDYKAAAAHMGRTVRWVKLHESLTRLSPKWQALVADPADGLSRLSVGHLVLVARFAPEVQDQIARDMGYSLRNCQVTVDQLDRDLNEQYVRLLSKRPWAEANDATLVPTAGPCDQCIKRSSRQGELFADAVPEPMDKEDRCLDPACWLRKTAAWLKVRYLELNAKHREDLGGKQLVTIETEYPSQALTQALKAAKVRSRLDTWEWTAVKKSDAGAVPALVVCGPGTGTIKWITERGDTPSPGVQGAPATPEKPDLERLRDELAERREARVADLALEALPDAALPEPAVVVRLAAAFGTIYGRWQAEECWTRYDELDANGMEPAYRELWQGTIGNICEMREVDSAVVRLCKLAGIDLAPMRALAEAELPEPPEWAALEAKPKAKSKSKSKSKSKRKPAKAAK